MVTVPWSIGRDLFRMRHGVGESPARRSLYVCALFMAGYAIAAFALPHIASMWWFAGVPVVVTVAVLTSGWACRASLCVAVVLLGSGWYAARIHERPAESAAWAVEAESEGTDPPLATVRGVVIDVPRVVQRGRFSRSEPAVVLTLAISAWEREGVLTSAVGTLRVSVEETDGNIPKLLQPGAAVRMTGRLRPVRPSMNPGEPDWLALAAQEGRVGNLDIPSAGLITERMPEGWIETARTGWHGAIGAMHARCVRALGGDSIQNNSSDRGRMRARALLGALLLGERDDALDDVNGAFTRLGLLHLVAISGFNLMIMAAFASAFLRVFGDRRFLEPIVIAGLIVGYMLVLPAQAPILRAGVIVLVLLVSEASGRRYDRATLLGWIAVGLLIIRPLDAWSMGFQLSFGIVAALLLLGSTVHARMWGVPLRGLIPEHVAHGRRAWQGWWWRWAPWAARWTVAGLKRQVSAGMLAWAVSVPIIACHTGQVGALTPPMTIIVLPVIVVVLWGGYAALLVGTVAPGLAGIVSPALEGLAKLLIGLVTGLDRLPFGSIQMPRVSAAWSLAAIGAVCYVCVRGRRRDRWTWAMLVAMVGWLVVEIGVATRLPSRVALRIDSLAVGDGSCHLIRRGGEAALWDCGSLTTGIGEQLVPRAMLELGVRHVPTVVITHGHIDHFAGLPDVVAALHVRRVYLPEQLRRAAERDPASAPAALLGELATRGVEVRTLSQGDIVQLAGMPARVLWPPGGREFRDANDSSIVAMLPIAAGAEERRVLLTGDAAREALAGLLPEASAPGTASDLRADVLELPHHGAYIEPAVELVREANPGVVIQSTGPRRAADHRWDPILAGRHWHCTARGGAAWVEIGENGDISSGEWRGRGGR